MNNEHKDERGPKIHGNALSVILQREWNSGGGIADVLSVAKKCVSGLTEEQIIKIAHGAAYLDGNTWDGLEYVEK